MIDIQILNGKIKPLTRWAANEFLDEGVIEFGFDTLEENQDFLDSCINKWFDINEDAEFMLSQLKFENKIEYLA